MQLPGQILVSIQSLIERFIACNERSNNLQSEALEGLALFIHSSRKMLPDFNLRVHSLPAHVKCDEVKIWACFSIH